MEFVMGLTPPKIVRAIANTVVTVPVTPISVKTQHATSVIVGLVVTTYVKKENRRALVQQTVDFVGMDSATTVKLQSRARMIVELVETGLVIFRWVKIPQVVRSTELAETVFVTEILVKLR